jgi:NAD(P)-dependent dehydrogenase (short-subunit alcohol dehydrogenase family)
VTQTNLLGTMNCARVALRGFVAQGQGQLYNFEGFGSNGKMFRTGLAPYGATKCAIRYLTRALAREVAGTNVQVAALSPGIVVTDLLLKPYARQPAQLAKAQRIFNVLADHVETVTPYLAQRVLENRKSGVLIAWLTTPKVLARFLCASFRKRNLFEGHALHLPAGEPAHARRPRPPAP